jgi:L-asparagine oxygenase
MEYDTDIERLWNVFANSPSMTVEEATSWTVVPGFFGSGTILVGPSAEAPGTAAVIPPGVWARNPDGYEHPLSRDGWRLCRWAPRRLIDENRPVDMVTVELEQLIAFLRERKSGLPWVEHIVTRQIRLLRSLAKQAAKSGSPHESDVASSRAVALERQATAAFERPIAVALSDREVADLAQDWPEAELERDRLSESPASMDSSFEISLSDSDRGALWAAAHEVARRDAATEADAFVIEAQVQASRLSDDLRRRLMRFRRFGGPVGGLLISGVPTGEIPPTPRHADYAIGAKLLGAAAMSIVVSVLGDQFGFSPELGGNIVQDIVPVRGFEDTQQAISSTTALDSHVDKAFSENRADYVALLCLRPDHEGVAATTLSSIGAIMPLLDAHTISVLRTPRFETAVDGSFLRGAGIDHPIHIGAIQVLSGDAQHPRLRADFAETRGIDREAQKALDRLNEAAREVSVAVYLKSGDLLLIDNRVALSGRTSFTARWDGNDRWLLRTFITSDLARSAPERPGGGRIVHDDLLVAAGRRI